MVASLQHKQGIAAKLSLACLTLLFSGAVVASANPGESADPPTDAQAAEIYRSPEERREAGLRTRLTDWLSFSGLAEIGAEAIHNKFQDDISSARSREEWYELQLGFNITLSDRIDADLIFTYDNADHGELDEGVLNFENDLWGISVGRQYLPFGQYYSHFVTSPMLVFGETRATALTVQYSYKDALELSAFALESRAESTGGGSERPDWGLGIEYSSEDEVLTVGAGYLSDLAETNQSLLEDFDNVYEERVAGLSAYALVAKDKFEITAELVKTLRSFAELESGENAPLAWNIELAYFPAPSFQLTVRVEGSDELIDQPERQYGASATWRIGKRATLAVDYLFGTFKEEFVFDDDDNELRSRHLVAVQLSIEF